MTAGPWIAAVALGSNLGDRAQHLERAARDIAALPGVRVLAVSKWIETEAAEDAAGQGRFLNGAVVLETFREPRDLMRDLLAIERAHGRERPSGVRHAPRTLDIDLLVHGARVVDEPDLKLPHPRLRERPFVLAPLCEIAPDLVVPADENGPACSVRDLLRARLPRSVRAGNG